MTGGYWYVEGGNGERFAWAKTPSFSCPFDKGPPAWLEDTLDGSEDDGAPTGEALRRMFVERHRRQLSGIRARVDGKLTDRCSACGAKLTRHGFAAWAERPREAEDTARDRAAGAFGFELTERLGDTRYFRTKKRAEEWARREAAKSREKVRAA